ncbi:MAG: HYR domain-containing protein, partial [Saprospiraceae bacterium]|nr:HYR domain-containing protein [Saprospiraceae bacterium]
MKSFTKSFLSILLCFLLNLLITGNLKAHTWEVRVNQNPDGSLTWYLQNWHSFSEQACHDYANQSGLVINGVQYPVQSVHQGSIVPLSPTIFGACSTNDNRDCYGIINTPFLGSPLSVSTYSNVACWASCGIQAQGNFNPPPPPVCTTCPIIDFDSNVSCSDNGTICTSTDDIYTFSITVNHLACASITGDGQFTVIVDPGGANIVLGPFNYNSGITTDVFLPAGTVNGTTIKVLDDDFPCDFQDQLSVDPSLLMGCSVDNDYPTFINCPQGVTFTVGLFSGSCTGGAIWSIPIAEDECGVVVTQTDGPMLGEILTAGSYHLEYTATDPSGNTTICSFTIEVLDTEEPVIVCPANCVVSHTDPGVCTWTSPAGCFTPLLAASNCPATISWEVVNPDGTTSTGNDDVSGYTFQLGTSTVTYTIEETASGQTWTCSFTVTVEDNEVPVIECPADIVVVNDQGECGAVVTFDDPNVTDNCTLPTANSSITFDYTGAEQTWTVPAGVTSITIQSWGGQGGESRSCTGGPDPEFDGGLGGFASGTLSVTPGQVIYINVGGKGLVGNDGTADGGWNGGGDGGFWAGGGGGASDIRTVSGDLNTRVIVAAGGGGGNTGCPNHGQGGDGGGLIGLDGLSFFGWDPSTGGTQGAGGLGGGSGQNGSFGQGGGTNPGDEYHVGGGGGGWYGGGSAYAAGGSGGSSYIDGVTGGTTMSGAQSGNGVVIISYGMGSPLSQVSGLPSGDVFPVGVTENVFWATDASGNTASCSFTVTVTDEEKPEIECPENANIPTSNLGTTGDCAGQYTWEHPVPTDNCGVVHYTVMYTNADGTIDGPFDVYTTSSSVGLNNGPATGNRHFDLGVTNITYTVEDANGNVETCSFTVTVTDDEDPTFVNCPEGVTFTVGLFSDDCQGGAIWSIPVADDNCGATVTQSDGPLQGAILGVGTYAIQYTATDAANNTATCNFTIEVIDTEDPVIVCPGNVVIDETDPGVCTWTSPANSLTPLLAASNCPAEITWEVVNPDGGTETGNNDVSGYTFQLGTSTVTYTIEETASGQTWTCSFTVTVEDHEDPMIECPADIVVVNDPGECGAVVTFDDPTISDNCEINGSSEEVIFDYTGAEQTWVVPAGVTSIMVNAIGAKGGDGASTQGGLGGQVTATLAVTPGETLRIYVGGQGNTCDDISPSPCQNGGFNGGGNTNVTCNSPGNPQHAGTGGGASDIRRGGNALTDRILVAAGGGGGGFASFGPPSPGGNGGGLDGEDAPDWSGFVQGMGGSQIAGGAPSPQGGTAGSLGQGGNGQASCGGGGGGGGGYYGGGGGWVGGGGGGSSSADPGATDVVH